LNKQGQNTPTTSKQPPPKIVTITQKPYIHHLISTKHTVGFIHHSGKEYHILFALLIDHALEWIGNHPL